MATRPSYKRNNERLKPPMKGQSGLTPRAQQARRKFLRFFPEGFADETYFDWERQYKWAAHEKWCASLRRSLLRTQLDSDEYDGVAKHAVTIESRTNLLFSFEKMALRDAVKSRPGARAFAEGLYEFLYRGGGGEAGSDQERFERWVDVIESLPRRQTRVLTWPMTTIFGFVAQPDKHIFLKPMVTRRAAEAYGFDFHYQSRPNWETYVSMLEFAELVRKDTRDLGPRDMIDLQSFIWVQGSDEYE